MCVRADCRVLQSWMMHALTSLYDHTGNSSYLDMASLLFDTVQQSDDTTCWSVMHAHDHESSASSARLADKKHL